MIGKKTGRWGDCEYFLKDEYVGRSIHYYGEYNPDETEKILSLVTGDGWCLDIGANIGCITQALGREGHSVIAFEPQPEVHALLARNASYASDDIITYNAAVGAECGTAEMPKIYYSEKNNIGGLGIGMKSLRGNYEVKLVSIDSLKLGKVSFMKIDVEGYELEVLKGARETILRDKPVMYIEDDRIEKRAALREYIAELGYTYEMHQPTLYRENNFFGLKKNVWDKDYASHNLICRPKC